MAFWGLILLTLAGSTLTGGGYELWTRAALYVVIALLFLLFRPMRSLGWFADILLLGFLALAAFQLVPWPDMLRADWVHQATQELGIALSGSLSPQRLISLEALPTILAGVLWLYLLLSHPPQAKERFYILAGFVLLTTLLGIGAIVGNMEGWTYPFSTVSESGRPPESFTFFPNRNHTGLLLAMGATTAFGMLLAVWRNRVDYSVMLASAFGILVVAIVMNLSRGPVFLLGIGCLLQGLRYLGRNPGTAILALLVPVFLMAALLTIFSEQPTAVRLMETLRLNPESFTARLYIYLDTLHLFSNNWLSGVGLANFEYAFPIFQESLLTEHRIIHPESDYLWLLAEFGLPGLLFLTLAGFVLWELLDLSHLRELETGRYVAAMTLALFLIHSSFDVPGHRLGTFLLAGLFLALAARPLEIRSRTHGAILASLALALLATGSAWCYAHFNERDWHSHIRWSKLTTELNEARQLRDLEGALEVTEQMQDLRPMAWKPYLIVGSMQLSRNWDTEAAIRNFDIARFLKPWTPEIYYIEGSYWLDKNSNYTFELWKKCLERCSGSHIADRMFQKMRVRIGNSVPWSGQLADSVWQVRETYPQLVPTMIHWMPNSVAQHFLYLALGDEKLMQALKPGQHKRLIQLGFDKRATSYIIPYLKRKVRTDRSWAPQLVRALVAERRLQDAVEIFLVLTPEPERPRMRAVLSNERAIESLRKRPEDIITAKATITRASRRGEWYVVISLAELCSKRDDYLRYWAGKAYATLGRYEEAWEELKPLVK